MKATIHKYIDTQGVGLTDLESVILVLISKDCSDEQIAHVLATSTETIRTAINDLFTNLGLSSRLAAAVWAIQRRLPNGNFGIYRL